MVLGFEMKNKVPGFKELSQMREANDQASRKSEVYVPPQKQMEGVRWLREEHLRG